MDLDAYPALADVQYHIVNMSAGDCLFVPYQWVFQDRSFEATITLMYNLNHHHMVMIDSNDQNKCLTQSEYDEKFTLDQIDWNTQREPPNLKFERKKTSRWIETFFFN